MARHLIKLTESKAFNDPFFSRNEESILSLLTYYFEDLFEPFADADSALNIFRNNARAFQFSLDVFQKAFNELPEASKAKQVFAKTPFVSLTPNWEDSDRKVFMHTLFGLRRRLEIPDLQEPALPDEGSKYLS